MTADPFTKKRLARQKMTDAGWTETATAPSMSAEYRLGIVRLEFHALCETWRARVGSQEWGHDASTPERALTLCLCPSPAADDMRAARESLTRQIAKQEALL